MYFLNLEMVQMNINKKLNTDDTDRTDEHR